MFAYMRSSIPHGKDRFSPGPFIDSLAMGFPNLRQLSVHVELGSRRMELELQLEKQLAQQLFRETRQHLQEQSLERFDDDEFYGNLYDSSDETSGVDREGHDAYREEWQESVLTESNAQAFGNDLFSRRHGPSNLKKITLRTGEKLRHDLGRRNLYSFDEDRFERIFEIYSPPNEGDEPFLKELESEQTRRIRKTSERLDRMFGPCNYVC
ncbi:uncharacterized protein N7479_003307 [Penicillium vulpinum]|uniref:uncharacterized protein n=1 Tax=Penicillium vulpinum TaxID=29845 RepID=UPI0025475C2A|nr:uncharacterized protein N7479_003307 [Penicillium vulpinum]KAJ5963431.1 hypothetical protein N7479_003307 [Penicillium vulpinum]